MVRTKRRLMHLLVTHRKKFLFPDEVILESGLVWKRKGRSVKKRQLILTNRTRIIYIDPKRMVLKGEIPWSLNLRPEAKNATAWFIHTVQSIPSFTDNRSQRGLIFLKTFQGMPIDGWTLSTNNWKFADQNRRSKSCILYITCTYVP